METISILFCSISGNTRSFIDKITTYAKQQNAIDKKLPLITSTEITDLTVFKQESTPFFVCVPTYLTGGNGIDTGVGELMTNTLGEYITYKDNAKLVKGIIGSGNKNFNIQYILTAKRYATLTNTLVIADYELRGTNEDVIRIYNTLTSLNTN